MVVVLACIAAPAAVPLVGYFFSSTLKKIFSIKVINDFFSPFLDSCW
jgi:hypothetical protein